jgi:hypothetical protein
MKENKEETSVRPQTDSLQFNSKRPYERPCLIEWGSLRELTAGPFSGLQDAVEGGTENE